MKPFVIIISLFVISFPGWGQCSNDIIKHIETDNSSGTIDIDQPLAVGVLLKRHVAANCKYNTIPGYRIRIFSDLSADSREKALEVRSRFYQLYSEDIPVYIVYVDPNFKVYVGDFKTRNETILFLREIKRYFPNAFPISTQINFPELK